MQLRCDSEKKSRDGSMNNNSLARRYLELLKKSLLNLLYVENEARLIGVFSQIMNSLDRLTYHDVYDVPDWMLATLKRIKDDGSSIMLRATNADGTVTSVPSMRNYTELAHTMIGKKRLDNIQYCMETVLADGIPGDVLEAGIWRGGAAIFMRGVFAAYGVTDRTVWAADSFQGVPAPTHPADRGLDLSSRLFPILAVSRDAVSELFERYELLDEQVKFIAGWFKESLVAAPIERLAVLRLDGDLYESTIDTLEPLYAKVATGGFIIVDDYYSCPPCGAAVEDFRRIHGITDPLVRIDDQGVYWRKV
jgi:O-methyltransferase